MEATLTARQQRILAGYYEREDRNPNNGLRDHVYGLDDELVTNEPGHDHA